MKAVLKIFFKIFNFFFGWKSLLGITKSKYSKNLGERIGATVILSLFVAASIACEFWMMATFKTNVAAAILILILFCALASTSFKLLILYSAVAFDSAKEAKNMEAVNNTQGTETAQQEVANNDPLANTESQEQVAEEKPIKTYRKFDITMGFVFMFLALAMLATLIAVPVIKLKALAK